MKNYEQRRAIHALNSAHAAKAFGKYSGEGGSEAVVKKIPALIISHGLLGTLAFALNKNDAHLSILEDVADYLAQENFIDPSCARGEKLMNYLSEQCTASDLRLITDEVMAYLSYLRRF